MLFTQQSFSQVFYSVKPDYLLSKREGNNLLRDYKEAYPDTSITDLHNFFPRNFMGNIGLPSPDYILHYKSSDIGFRFYPSPVANDMFADKNVEYFRTKGAYASVTGIAGSKQLQVLKLIFTHTYQNRFNITLKFNRYSSQGFYLKQQTNANNFYLSLNSATKKKRAGYYFYVLNNTNRNQENGGIAGDTLNDSLALINPKTLLPVKITSAKRENKEYKVMLNPWFKLSREADSLDKFNSYIQIKSAVSFNSYLYRDQNIWTDKYYFLYYLDTVQTYDSSAALKLSNELSYNLLKGKKGAGISVGYRNEINKVWQQGDSLFHNNIAFADLFFKKESGKDSASGKSNYLENYLNVQYIAEGVSAGNYKAENNLIYSMKHKSSSRFFKYPGRTKKSGLYL
jgi:hypothetical protein